MFGFLDVGWYHGIVIYSKKLWGKGEMFGVFFQVAGQGW